MSSSPVSGTHSGTYIGRFAPSPSGPLHRGSMVAAMASYLDARAHNGRWLLRIEDIDRVRSRDDATRSILGDLNRLGFQADDEPWHQSLRLGHYQEAFARLQASSAVYPCACSRKEIADSQLAAREAAPSGPGLLGLPRAPVYPGTCRSLACLPANRQLRNRPLRAWRFKVNEGVVAWTEGGWLSRAAGPLTGQTLHEQVAREVGDFVIARPSADSALDWTYQLSVVVDDAQAGITHVVRGMDLIDSTGRQIVLQQALGYATPLYWHCPLVIGSDGQKLSKQNGALAIDVSQPLQVLNQAMQDLALPGMSAAQLQKMSLNEFWLQAMAQWRDLRMR